MFKLLRLKREQLSRVCSIVDLGHRRVAFPAAPARTAPHRTAPRPPHVQRKPPQPQVGQAERVVQDHQARRGHHASAAPPRVRARI